MYAQYCMHITELDILLSVAAVRWWLGNSIGTDVIYKVYKNSCMKPNVSYHIELVCTCLWCGAACSLGFAQIDWM